MTLKIAAIGGDGIGPEVVEAGLRVLTLVSDRDGLDAQVERFDFGAQRYLTDGISLPPGQIDVFRRDFDAIFLGALGDPRVPDSQHARDILLGLRFELDLFANYRPVECLDESLCPLKGRTAEDVNFVVLRENTEGPYVSIGGNLRRDTPHEVAITEDVNTWFGVERILRAGFSLARGRAKKLVVADKANAMPHGHGLWRRVLSQLSSEYPDVHATPLYADAVALLMVQRPQDFDVIVAPNLLGDVLSDLGAALQGGMGFAASANLGTSKLGLFEPVHGSAPDIVGKNRANPIAAILTVAAMLEHLDCGPSAAAVRQAVKDALASGIAPADIGGEHSTEEITKAILARLA